MSLPQETQVLVVGAGPTGLVSAITLAQLGLQVTVVDSSTSNPNGSRATGVHAHTLERLDTIGLARPLIDAGMRFEGVLVRGATEKLLEIEFSSLNGLTEFPFGVLIPQDEAEAVFRKKLLSEGIQIHRNKAVVGLRQADGFPGAEVTFEDGSVIRTQYVVGADGSRSTIRCLAGIEFKNPHTGVAYDDPTVLPYFTAVLADVYLAEPLPESIPRNRLSVYADNFFSLIPLRSPLESKPNSSTFWRIACGVPNNQPRPPRHPSIEYIQQKIDERNPWDTKITISSVTTSSSYKIREAVASTYFQKLGEGNILLVGDAAHVHSPAGGQGMNLGICDAVSVARAIQLHVEAKDGEHSERDAVLQHYADSRRKIGVRVIGLAGGVTGLISAGTGWRRLVRNMILRLVRSLPFLKRFMIWRISGLANRGN